MFGIVAGGSMFCIADKRVADAALQPTRKNFRAETWVGCKSPVESGITDRAEGPLEDTIGTGENRYQS